MDTIIGHEVDGDGQPLLLLAGWTRSRHFWHRPLPHLTGDFRCVIVDNRETGDTGPCPDGFTIGDLAADALAVMDHLGIDRFHLCGHSMGGMIAQELAREAPERVQTLVLVSTHGGQSVAEPVDASTLLDWSGLELPNDPEEMAAAIGRALVERLIGPASEVPASVLAAEEVARASQAGSRLDGTLRQYQAIEGFDPGDAVARLGLPVTVVHGDADPLVLHSSGQRLADRHGVELVSLPGVGHMVPWEAPGRFAEILRSAVGAMRA